MTVYFNGKFLEEDALLPISNELSFLRGYAIFDFFGFHSGVPLFIDDYLDRFYNSANQVGLRVPLDRQAFKKDIMEFISMNKIRSGYCKMILTGGYASDGFRSSKENLYLFPMKPIHYPDEMYTRGVKIILDEFKREIPEVKTTNYMNAIIKVKEMDDAGAIEILYHDGGQIRECSRCNFFLVKGNTLITQSTDILKGITRKQILSIAQEIYEVEVRPVMLEELLDVDEAFITSTTKLLLPVVQVGDHVIGNGKVGEVTLNLFEKLEKHIWNYVQNELLTLQT